ncbi:MAG: type VI secretion system tube protein Hcp [Planctomycetota bacterium]
MFIYMQVDQIKGVGDEPRPDWIWLDQCTFGFERKETSTEKTSEAPETKVRAVASSVAISKPSDLSTPSLVSWMASGQPRKVKIEYSLVTDLPYVEFTLTNAVLNSYSSSFEASGTGGSVIETLSIEYEDIELDYWEQGQTNEDAALSSFKLEAGA